MRKKEFEVAVKRMADEAGMRKVPDRMRRDYMAWDLLGHFGCHEPRFGSLKFRFLLT